MKVKGAEIEQLAIHYFKRFTSFDEFQLRKVVGVIDPKVIIVIPCFNEPDLLTTLRSLCACISTQTPIHVVVVLNESVDPLPEHKDQNNLTQEAFQEFVKKEDIPSFLTFEMIDARGLPKKKAGVGLARKIGLDAGLKAFAAIATDGWLVWLDADCTVSPNYLIAIEEQVVKEKILGIAHMAYLHQYQRLDDQKLAEGIEVYELFLRIYAKGLEKVGFPYSYQTIGSCLLVKASVYAKFGGMNQRKAGEDFYFIHKIAPHVVFKEITSGFVYPSCRISDRVPFGTGKAQGDYLAGNSAVTNTYNQQSYQDLIFLFQVLPDLYESASIKKLWSHAHLSIALKAFLESQEFSIVFERLYKSAATFAQFRKQFFAWFDGFMVMKWMHFARDQYYPNQAILEIANWVADNTFETKGEALVYFRNLDYALST